LAPLRSITSLRRYVGSSDDWRQAVWNRWLVSYLTPRPEDAEGGGQAAEPRSSAALDAASVVECPPPPSAQRPAGVSVSGPLDADRAESRPPSARARLEALSQQMCSLEEGLDAVCQRLNTRELSERRSSKRMMELLERVAEAAERQSEALERCITSLERVERRLGLFERWVRPPSAEGFPPAPLSSDIVGLGVGSGVGSGGACGWSADTLPPSQRPSISGSLGDMSVATLLSMFELEKRTGWLAIDGDTDRVRFELLDGSVVRGCVNDRFDDPLDVLRTALNWRVGTFSFCHGPVFPGERTSRSVGAMLLEASHQNDEALRMHG
jgi:hypothetical protein